MLTSSQLSLSPDSTLVSYAKSGVHEAYTELVRRHSKMVSRVAYRITRNAEDVLQETLLGVFAHIQSFDGRSAFTTWLTRIAINNALRVLRRRPKFVMTSIDDEDAIVPQLPDMGKNPEQVLGDREQEKALHRAVARLPSSIRLAIEARYLGERSTRETALLVESTFAATKSRLLRGKRMLRCALQ